MIPDSVMNVAGYVSIVFAAGGMAHAWRNKEDVWFGISVAAVVASLALIFLP